MDIITFDQIRESYGDGLSMYQDGYISAMVNNNHDYINLVISRLEGLGLLKRRVDGNSARYCALGLEICHMFEKILTFGDRYYDDMSKPISRFLDELVSMDGSEEIIENHYFSTYFGLYIEYEYARECYQPPDDIIPKLLVFGSLSIEEKKRYGKVRKNIMSDPLLPRLRELIVRM